MSKFFIDEPTTIMQHYYDTCMQTLLQINTKGLKKSSATDGDITLLKSSDWNELLKYNYTQVQLKTIAKGYRLKLSGTKQQLTCRIYAHMFVSFYASKVQRWIRALFQKRCSRLQGPAFRNRALCTNVEDFLSMDPVAEIPSNQFFSFRDSDGFVYGFDVLSFYHLKKTQDATTTDLKNPYNKKSIEAPIVANFDRFVRLSILLQTGVNLVLQDINKEVSKKKAIELRTLGLFQKIDALGNYSNPQWFLSLNLAQLSKYMRELVDIWAHRASLSIAAKKAICHPDGAPFSNLRPSSFQSQDIDDVRKVVLTSMENLVNRGTTKDNQCLGATYVLCALTLVNSEAATALPWLYEAAAFH